MKVTTQSGTEYEVCFRAGFVFPLAVVDNGKLMGVPISVAFVGPLREQLVHEVIEGRRELMKSKSINGKLAVGFSGSSATLEPSTPFIGARMLLFVVKSDSIQWHRFSTPIAKIE